MRAPRILSPIKIKLRVGDNVVVLKGKYKGQTGQVLAVHPTLNKVTVEGVNVVKRHQKPDQAHPQGGIIEKTQPIWVSKVAIVEPTTKKASKIGYSVNKEGVKVRTFKSTGKEIK